MANKTVPQFEQVAIRYFCGVMLLCLTLALGAFNVNNWAKEDQILLAVIAVFSEMIGLAMAIVTENALRARQWVKGIVSASVLLACASFNIIGGERAWAAGERTQAETVRVEAQASLDAQRQALTGDLAEAQAQVRSYAYLLPTPETSMWRQAGMQRAWEAAAAPARAQEIALQARLDALPLVATATVNAFPNITIQTPLGVLVIDPDRTGFSIAEVVKALGLWCCGFGVAASIRSPVRTPETGRATPEETDERLETGVVMFPWETQKALVLRLKAKGFSYGQIQKQTGVGKGTAWKWCNPKVA